MDWRTWTAADRASVTYLLLQRNYKGDHKALRELYELVDDQDALAALSREIMGQPATMTTDR